MPDFVEHAARHNAVRGTLGVRPFVARCSRGNAVFLTNGAGGT